MKITAQWNNLRFLLKPWWKNGKALMLGSFFSSVIILPAAGYFTATLAQAVIEKAQTTNSIKKALLTGLMYFLAAFGLTLLKALFDDYYLRWKKQEIEGKIERSIYEKALTVDYSYFDDPAFFDSYKLATEKFASQSSETVDYFFSMVGEIAKFAIYGYLIASQGWILFFIVVLCSAFTVYAQIYWSKVSVDRETVMVNERRRGDYLQRLFYNKTATADMRTTHIAEPLFGMFDKSVQNRVSVFQRYAGKEFLIDIFVVAAQLGTTFAVPAYVVWGICSGNLSSIGVYATLIASAMSLKETLNSFGWWSSQVALGVAYSEKVQMFFAVASTVQKTNDGLSIGFDPFSVTLDHVFFRYPNSDFSIKDISISIASGQKIAIVGENGAGKSTLTKLLLRLYDTEKGEIRINGIPIRQYNIAALRNRIGVAFQDSILYALSVRENMTAYYGCDDEKLKENLISVGLDMDLSSQVTKEFDENGMVLSGGDAQRLCLSRLLHNDFGLLILDEPSSALDPIAEYNMAKLIFSNSPTTTIMVAHRLSTVVDADKIYLLDNGGIAECGTHSELMKKQGKYAEMFSKQAEGYQHTSDT